MTPTRPSSRDADRARASQRQHTVEHVDGHAHLTRPTLIRGRASLVPDHPCPSSDGGLDPSLFPGPGGFLPSHAAPRGNELEGAVAPRGLGLGRLAGHGRAARQHNDGRLRMARGEAGVDTVLIVRTVARERGETARNLVEQGADLGAVIGLMAGQRRGYDLAGVGVHAKMGRTSRFVR